MLLNKMMIMSWSPALSALLVITSLPSPAVGQGGAQGRKESSTSERIERFNRKSVDELIADLEKDPTWLFVVHRLRVLGDPKAIPALKEAFQKVKDKDDRQVIAAALVALGERDPVYWNFLLGYAKAAVESDMPDPLKFDRNGQVVRGEYAPEFLDWARRHNVDPANAAGDALYILPGDVYMLALTAEPRARDILYRGLSSRNPLIAARAAQGLARLQDEQAVKRIIQAAERAPAEAAAVIAQALVFFDDPEAQRAAERFVTSKPILESLRKKRRERGARGVFE